MLRSQEVNSAQEKIGKKWWRKVQKNIDTLMYDVIILNGKEAENRGSSDSESELYYVPNNELFDILHDSHISIGQIYLSIC
jgi:hypothetical protein